MDSRDRAVEVCLWNAVWRADGDRDYRAVGSEPPVLLLELLVTFGERAQLALELLLPHQTVLPDPHAGHPSAFST